MKKDKLSADKASRSLEPMKPGDIVYVQNAETSRWDSTATIIKKRSNRSYIIEADGWKYLKNRKFLKPHLGSNPPDDGESGPMEATPNATHLDEARYPKRTNAGKRVHFKA